MKESAEKGAQIKQDMEKLNQRLQQLSKSMGGRGGRNESSNRRIGTGFGGEAQQGLSGSQGGESVLNYGGRSLSVPAGAVQGYDDYRPSYFDPPEIRNLGSKSERLGEFADSTSQKDPLGGTPVEERYPAKYEGLVETYFKVLADTGE